MAKSRDRACRGHAVGYSGPDPCMFAQAQFSFRWEYVSTRVLCFLRLYSLCRYVNCNPTFFDLAELDGSSEGFNSQVGTQMRREGYGYQTNGCLAAGLDQPEPPRFLADLKERVRIYSASRKAPRFRYADP